MSDLISRQNVFDAILRVSDDLDTDTITRLYIGLSMLPTFPSEKPEPLTDEEMQIFLAAMGREMKVCEETDRNYTREPYKDSLSRTCHEIIRKVKNALWT